MGPLSIHALLCAFKSRYQTNSCPQIQHNLSISPIPLCFFTPEKLESLRKEFVHDLLLAHLGVVSHRFYWEQESGKPHFSGSFVWRGDALDAIAFQVTHGSLSTYLKAHLLAATAFRRLDWLSSKAFVSNAVTEYRSYVWLALLHAVSEWLRVYAVTMEDLCAHYSAMKGTKENELLALSHLLRPLMPNML